MFTLVALDSVGSTSDEVLRLAREGAPHGTVVTAREQTAGRGRAGRGWDSPPGNLYLSVLLRLDLPPRRIAELSFVAALAVADTVDAFPPARATLKWPNDVLVGGAKIAGILVEHAEGVAIVGMGVNVAHCPAGTAYRVTSLLQEAARAPQDTVMPGLGPGIHVFAGGQKDVDTRIRGHDGSNLIGASRTTLLNALFRRLDTWLTHGFPAIRADWLVRAHAPGTPLRAGETDGTFATIDTDGALLLDTPNGRVRIVGGEVQRR
ncbi:MAG: biotin--[acetyl-CoA-carboxylase] ligase [Acetobacteraceae bacterium]